MIDFEKILSCKGKNKADLARFLEISPTNVNRVIKNERIPFSQIENICSFLDISIIDALRISGYNDTPGISLSVENYSKLVSDLSEPLTLKLLEMFKDGSICPGSAVEAKEKEIERLNRLIGSLERKIEILERNS